MNNFYNQGYGMTSPYGGGYGMGYGGMGGYGGAVFGSPYQNMSGLGQYNSNMMYQQLLPLLTNLLYSRMYQQNLRPPTVSYGSNSYSSPISTISPSMPKNPQQHFDLEKMPSNPGANMPFSSNQNFGPPSSSYGPPSGSLFSPPQNMTPFSNNTIKQPNGTDLVPLPSPNINNEQFDLNAPKFGPPQNMTPPNYVNAPKTGLTYDQAIKFTEGSRGPNGQSTMATPYQTPNGSYSIAE